MIDSITLVGDIIDNGSDGIFTYSFSFFRSSSSFLWFFPSLLLSGSRSSRCCRCCRRCRRSRSGSVFGHRSRLGHRRRRGSFVFRDFTIGYVVNLIGENHTVVGLFLSLFRMLEIICKRHSVIRIVGGIVSVIFIFIFVKLVRINRKNHINRFFYRLFCSRFLGRSFLYRFFCNGFLGRSFLYGFFCNGFLDRSLLYRFFCSRFLDRSFLYGLFCNRFLYRSFLYRLFQNRLIGGSFFLCLFLCKALFNLIEKGSSIFSSLFSLFFFLSDLFFYRFSDSSFSIFLFLSDSSFLLCLLTFLSRSHRTFFFVLFELLSVIFSVSEGCFSFLLNTS